MSLTSATKGAARLRAITPFGPLAQERISQVQFLFIWSPIINFYKLSCSYRLNMEIQSRFVFRRETEKKNKRCNFNTPEI